MEPRKTVKKKQSTCKRSNKSGLSNIDNSKRSQFNDIAINNLEDSTVTDSTKLHNISKPENDLEKTNVIKANIVILGDSSVHGKYQQTNNQTKYR